MFSRIVAGEDVFGQMKQTSWNCFPSALEFFSKWKQFLSIFIETNDAENV